MKRDGNYLVILSKHAPTRLHLSRVKQRGLLRYLQHVEAMQTRSGISKLTHWKYSNLLLILLRVQQGDCTVTDIPKTH